MRLLAKNCGKACRSNRKSTQEDMEIAIETNFEHLRKLKLEAEVDTRNIQQGGVRIPIHYQCAGGDEGR